MFLMFYYVLNVFFFVNLNLKLQFHYLYGF